MFWYDSFGQKQLMAMPMATLFLFFLKGRNLLKGLKGGVKKPDWCIEQFHLKVLVQPLEATR